MPNFPTAAELDLWDIEVPEGLAISVFPPAQEHMWDPFWWDQGGRDPFEQRFVFRMEPGPERTEKLKKIIEEYPRYGPKMYEKCAKLGRADIIRELLALGVSMDIDQAKRPNDSTREGDDAAVPEADMMPAIHVAALEGYLECIQVLVKDAGADINYEGDEDASAITWASAKGHFHIVEWLLANGATVCFKRKGLNDIQAAAKGGNVELVQLLSINNKPEAGRHEIWEDCLTYATFSGNINMVRFVLKAANYPPAPQAGGDGAMIIDTPTLSDKQTDELTLSLSIAIEKGSLEIVELLLSYLTPRCLDGTFEYLSVSDSIQARCFNATEDAMSNVGDNPALFQMVWETLFFPPLDKLDADEVLNNTYNDRLNRRLISACSEGCPQITRLLCDKYGANINHISHKYFSTPLGRAAGSGQNDLRRRLEVAAYLLKQPGIDIHLATGEYCNGPTALALAVREGQGQIGMTRLLIEHGGPVEEIDPAITQIIMEQAEDSAVTVHLIMSKSEPRFPVRIMTRENSDDFAQGGANFCQVELTLPRTELEQLIPKLQVRKRNAVLAASDPKKRPLNGKGDEMEDLDHAMRAHVRNQDFSQVPTTTE